MSFWISERFGVVSLQQKKRSSSIMLFSGDQCLSHPIRAFNIYCLRETLNNDIFRILLLCSNQVKSYSQRFGCSIFWTNINIQWRLSFGSPIFQRKFQYPSPIDICTQCSWLQWHCHFHFLHSQHYFGLIFVLLSVSNASRLISLSSIVSWIGTKH